MRLTAVDLACHRGGRDVFAGVSFSVTSGEVLAITGRNGAGKSSLLRTVVGLVRIAAGRLALEGGDPELTVAEQAHYRPPGCSKAVTLRGREPAILERVPRGQNRCNRWPPRLGRP